MRRRWPMIVGGTLLVMACCSACSDPCDFDLDGDVDRSDWRLIEKHFDSTDEPFYDVDGNGRVGISDMNDCFTRQP